MVISRLIGGLGNQMFQYAAGRALAVSNNCDLKLDVSGYKNYKLHNGYELNLFKIQAGIATDVEISDFVKGQSRLSRFISKKLKLKNKSHQIEKNFDYDPSFFEIKRPIYIDGYWQSYQYFESIESQLKLELTPTTRLCGLNLTISKQIAKCNSVSLHIRRGDYVSNLEANKTHGFIGIEYYNKAISFIHEQVLQPHFFVFSDDIAWARENLGLTINVVFINHNQGRSSFEDMRLMSLCKYNIIANSSFSWWGAWLNTDPNKIVIAPRQWFANMQDTSDLMPDNWLKM